MSQTDTTPPAAETDVAIVGAGFGGLGMAIRPSNLHSFSVAPKPDRTHADRLNPADHEIGRTARTPAAG